MDPGGCMSVLSKRSTVIRGGLVLVVGVTLSLFQNCSSKNFSAADSSQTQQGIPGTPGYGEIPTFTIPKSCVSVLQSITVPVKLLFVVDVSGSNVQGQGGDPASDPNKSYRGGSIQAFYSDFKSRSNFNWGFETFQGSGAKALISSGMPPMTSAIFSPNASDMQSAITAFQNTPDAGNTPYAAAMQMAQQAIQNDVDASGQAKYVVVFLSDGQPNPSLSDNQLSQLVHDLVNAKPGQVSFNTIYYGAPDLEASTRLLNMSKDGGGQFLDTNITNGRTFPISNVVAIPGVPCP